ncbi:spore germination protein [Peribacillus simplex]
MRTNSLSVKYFEVGRRTLTKVALLYMDDISDPEMVQTITKSIEAIDIDGIYGGNQFMGLIEGQPSLLFLVVIYDKKIKLHHLWIKTEKCVLTLR